MLIPSRYVADPSGGQIGGMSMVARYHDTQLARPVMIKQLHPGVDIGRLLDEIDALQSLRSPYVVQIYDVIPDAGGNPAAIVEEYVAGTDLEDHVGTLTPEQIIWVAYQMSSAIADIHDQGLIHRDIKPLNVKVDQEGTIRLLDFGLARFDGPDAFTFGTVGTPGYMAPELYVADSAGKVSFGKPVDVFALGATILKISDGPLPADLKAKPPNVPPSGANFTALQHHCPADLIAMLKGCFDSVPASRPTAAQLRVRLKRHVLRGKHQALINVAGQLHYLNSSNPVVTVTSGTRGSVQIRYDGEQFLVISVTGQVAVNNQSVSVGFEFPGSSVIAFGAAATGNDRVYATFDVSHPGVSV
jgi:serine/threonine-protein kinase